MGRSRFHSWWALVALLPVLLFAAPPAQAQDPPTRPYPSRGTYISDPPRQFCSEAERAAYIAAAEKALAIVEADADRARAYFISLRQRLGALAPGDTAGRQHLRSLTREFEHGDPNATTGEGPLHHMTITAPAEIEAKIAAARAAPIIDCSTLEAVASRRPQLDSIALPSLPTPLCSEAQRDAVRRQLEAARDAAREQIERTTRYLTELGGHDGLGWPAPNTPEHALFLANLRVERSWALDRNLANSRIQYQAEKRLEALAAMQVVPCDNPPQVGVVPGGGGGTPATGPVPTRPALPAGPAPIPTTPICTEAERRARISLIDAAITAADARLTAANAHLATLGALSQSLTTAKADFFIIQQITEETRSYQTVANALKAASDALRAQRAAALARPLDPCPPPAQPNNVIPGGQPTQPSETVPGTQPAPSGVIPGTPTQPDDGKAPAAPGGQKKACPPGGKRAGRAPISIGSNGKVGSGARTKKKLVSTLGGIAGGLLGGGGGGGGGGRGGPPVAKCKIKDSEKTVFTDPGTGISLRVGAKRSGDAVTVFADVAQSPDSGTFQGGWIEKPGGDLLGPSRADICDLWGEWSLSVSWTRETYADGNLVSRETGGYGDSGVFSLPGMLSSDAKPAGLWKQFGFSNASHGAREVALTYKLSRTATGEPMRLLVHVTRPSRNPVDTQPFELVMTEGPGGFRFTQAPPEEPCVPDPEVPRPTQ